jgi:regulator of protease activity HflC (stomatin/prohibitin superfamily)
MSIPFLTVCAILLIMLASSIKIIKEYQRAVVFRLGQFYCVRGPGLILLMPIVDKVEIIDLNRWTPGWQELGKPELENKIKSVALSNPGSIR